jgi:hypothetical protein
MQNRVAFPCDRSAVVASTEESAIAMIVFVMTRVPKATDGMVKDEYWECRCSGNAREGSFLTSGLGAVVADTVRADSLEKMLHDLP